MLATLRVRSCYDSNSICLMAVHDSEGIGWPLECVNSLEIATIDSQAL